MKRIVSVALVLLYIGVAFSVFAGGEQEMGDDKMLIGVAAANFDDKWMSYMHDGFRTAAEELGVEINMVDGKNDPAVQQSQIDTFITQGVDAIVIVPIQISTIGPMLDATEAAGIPMVSVNRIPDEPYLSRLATYVGSDEVYAGNIQGEQIAELLGGEGNVVIMWGELGHPAQMGRTNGAKEILDQFPGIQVIQEQTAQWQRALGLELMENWIQAGLDIDAVIANNDEMAIGAAMALEQVGMLDDVYIAGVDATPDALAEMKAGKIDVTVFQDAYGQGYMGLKAAMMAVEGEALEKITWVPYEPVTPAVVDEYIAKWE